MNFHAKFVFSLLVVALLIGQIGAFAESPTIKLTVNSDRKKYKVDKTVTLSGYISPDITSPDKKLLVQVFNPVGELYLSDSLNLTKVLLAHNSYYYSFDFGGKPAIPGNYEIMVSYGNFHDESVIYYLSENNDTSKYYSYIEKTGNQTFPIRYMITSGIQPDTISFIPSANLLQIGMASSADNETLTIEIPRAMIDAKSNGSDTNFQVELVKGFITFLKTPAQTKEITKSFATRTLKINLTNDLNSIWIYGTQVAGGNYTSEQNVMPSTALLSPLKQLKLGISSEDVKCRSGFTIVLKAEDGSPACVKLDDVQKLNQRGWSKG